MRRIVLVGLIAASCLASGYAAVRLCCTHEMSLEEAITLVGQDVTARQRKLAAAALRRRCLEALRALAMIAAEESPAGVEARNALEQIEELLR
jgi:hypothetical protein